MPSLVRAISQQHMAKKSRTQPKPESCQLATFVTARVTATKGSFYLTVAGKKPFTNMRVRLIPRIYIRQPEFWGIEVVGCVYGIGLPVVTRYVETIPLDGIIGTRGIEVIGKNKTKKIVISKLAAGRARISAKKRGKVYKCSHAGCLYFNQEVPRDHKHWLRCAHAGCLYFNQHVPPGHKHWFRCARAGCVNFNQFVPPGHKHKFKP